MPTVKYTAKKGLFQESGTLGLQINGQIDSRPSISGLTYSAVGDGAHTATANTLIAFSYNGQTARTVTLPAAEIGNRFALQLAPLLDGTNALTFDCAGTDAIREGTLIESRSGNKVVYDTSVSAETQLVFTPTATNCFADSGSMWYWSCVEKGIWDVVFCPAADPAGTGLTGAHAFAA